MACRCARTIAGWHLPKVVAPDPLARVIARGEGGGIDDAWALREELNRASEEVFGPPAYNPIPMPGWR
jgi:hypothetical protein